MTSILPLTLAGKVTSLCPGMLSPDAMASGHVAFISPLTLAGKLTSQFWAVRVSCDTMTSGDVNFPAIFSGDLQRSTEEEERTNFGGIRCFVKKHSTLCNQNTRKNSDKWYSEITHAKSQIENRNEAENGSDVTPTSPEETQNARPATFPVSNKKNKKIGADDTCFSNLFPLQPLLFFGSMRGLRHTKAKRALAQTWPANNIKHVHRNMIYTRQKQGGAESLKKIKKGESEDKEHDAHRRRKKPRWRAADVCQSQGVSPSSPTLPTIPNLTWCLRIKPPLSTFLPRLPLGGRHPHNLPFPSLPLRRPQNLKIK